MKIGILTFHRAHNFGAQMQMYGLYSFLSKKKFDVWILDYYCKSVEDVYKENNLIIKSLKMIFRYPLSGCKCLIKSIISTIHGYQRRKCSGFEEFLLNNFKLTKRFDVPECLPSDFDYLITGSDQLWNYKITKGRKEVFFLDNKKVSFVPKKIAYAVSSEKSQYNDLLDDRDYVETVLKSFTFVSVREKAFADFIRKNIGVDVKTVVDPTFFLTREDCLKIAVKPKETKYICVYKVTKTSYIDSLARKIAKEKKLKIINVSAACISYSKEESYSPLEILGFICYADLVLTSSFHGTALSIINRKPFYSAYDHDSERVLNILKSTNLENRFLLKESDYDTYHDVVYDEVVINEYVSYSKNQLLKALQ